MNLSTVSRNVAAKVPAIFTIIALALSMFPASFAQANEVVPADPIVEITPSTNTEVILCLDDSAVNYEQEGVCMFDTDPQTMTTTPEPERQACEIEGHKYDAAGSPLKDWTIGLMKVITFADSEETKDLANDVTDKDGYYCLEWDGYAHTEVITEPHSFTYRVYEVLKDGWKYLSVEEGTDINNLTVVADEDIQVADGQVSIQIGEVNGYIYANAEHHVDFYNTKIDGEDNNGGGNGDNDSNGDNDGNGGSNRNGSSGTRIKRAPVSELLGASTATPAGLVLGEATSTLPMGAPNTGAGGTAPVSVSLPTLVAILSTTTRRIK